MSIHEATASGAQGFGMSKVMPQGTVQLQVGSASLQVARLDAEVFLHWRRHGLIPIHFRCNCGNTSIVRLDLKSYNKAKLGLFAVACHGARVTLELNVNAFELNAKTLESALADVPSGFYDQRQKRKVIETLPVDSFTG